MIIKQKIFLSTPISAFESDDDYKKFRLWLLNAIEEIEKNSNVESVFCVAQKVGSINSLDEPTESLKTDIEELESSSVFILFYPKKICTSALIELGFAVAKKINILIISPNRGILPFMASQMDRVYENVHFIQGDMDDKETLILLLKYIKRLKS